MNTLYISDLDGTLLNEKAVLSDYTIDSLNDMIGRGMNFTIATARTPATVLDIMSEVKLSIPAILMNGVLIYDFAKNEYLKVRRIPIDTVTR
ncbi:MAG: HAD family hydrolase, partial [Lachnoclostridium sp.]|nr:HAD family hydrolase [Lachnoclostridium sp.]